MKLLLLLICLPLLGLDNSKTVHNQTAMALAGRAITLHWYLAQGEIRGYPRPYVNPSDTNVRQAASAWQADVKTRWRDGSRDRAITGVRSGDPAWSTGGGGLVSIVEASTDIATITFTTGHGLRPGDRLVISGATADLDLNRDHYLVLSAPSATTVTVSTQSVSTGTYNHAGLTVRHVIEPSGTGLCRIKSPNHRLEVSEEVTIDGVAGIAGSAGTWRVTATAQDEFLINTTCTGSYEGGGTVRGPDFGSVKTALVSFVSGVPASGSLKVDVVNSLDACHLGGAATCQAAGLDKAGMLAFNGGAWDARLNFTANVKTGSTGLISRSARTMLAAWDGVERYCGPRYWQRGPVVTQLIVEYGCEGAMTQDLGWKIVPGRQLAGAITTTAQAQISVVDAAGLEAGSRLWFLGSGNNIEHMEVTAIAGNTLTVLRAIDSTTPQTYANSKYFGVLQWEDAPNDGFKSIHPAFGVTFLSGWSGVRIETRVENVYWNRQQGVWYAPEIVVDGVTRLARSEMKHAAKTRWRRVFWSGSNPETFCEGGAGTDADDCAGTGGGTRAMAYLVDHNTDYLTYAGALLAWPRNPSATTYSWWYSLSGSGFNLSDRGDIGVDRRINNKQSTALPKYPQKYLGMGTWGADTYGSAVAEKDFQNGTQEGWPMPRALALWVQSWDKWGYDLLLGSSLPGSGGNSAVESYIPYLSKEDAPGRGSYLAGWNEPSAGRWLSTHVRPTMATTAANYYNSVTMPNDGPRVACWSASNTTFTSAIGTQGSQWPCWHYNMQGGDSWNLELAHMNDWSWTAWLVTGEDWHMQTMLAKAAFASAYGHATPYGRNIGKIWAYSLTNDLVRHESWGTQAILHALSAAPTELLYGQNGTPERNLLLAQAWDGVLFAEGVTAQTDGWASILYGPKFKTDCAGYTISLNNSLTSDRYLWGRCAMGQPSNPLGYFPPPLKVGPCSDDHSGILDCTKASHLHGLWMASYSNVVWNRSLEMGFPGYRHVRRKMGRMAINATLNKDFNGYLFGYYNGPTAMIASGTIPQTWAEWRSGFSANARAANSWTYIGGSTPLAVGYSYRMLSMLSFYTDLADKTTGGCEPSRRPPLGCTGQQAYAWYKQTVINQNQAIANDLKYYLQPRPMIADVWLEAGRTAAVARYTAPDGAACRYRLSISEEGDSLDGNDIPDVSTGRARSVALTGLLPDTDYWLRLTCGQARRTERFRSAVADGSDGATIRLRAPGGCGPLCLVRVEYSGDGAAWTPLAPRACAYGCSVNIPAGSQRAKHVRYTYYSDELGLARFAGPASTLLLVK